MSLAAGTRLGPYEVLGLIGSGGMGEVYKARDTRLDRTVAIKILPAELSADPDRRTRFEREAKTVAGLNHAHICTLYDVGDHDGAMFLVMEHLAGQTLAERLEKGPLPLEQALTIATEIADALSAAHRQGVIHRDLKPANVMLTKCGAKLLDFGLAKLTGHGEQPAAAYAVSAVRTQAATLTGQGVIVGTLQYMAPEQLEGKAADARTDLWALGAILYEMLTGKRAFEGTSAVSLMSAIMEREPAPLSSAEAPPGLQRVIRRCLEKTPDTRFQSAQDVAFALEAVTGPSTSNEASIVDPFRRQRRWLLPLALLAIVLALLAGFVAGTRTASPGVVSVPQVTKHSFERGTIRSARFSPDGATIVYSAAWRGEPIRMFMTREESFQSTPLNLDQGELLSISSSGELLVSLGCTFTKWLADGTLARVPMLGSTPQRLAEHVRDADWIPGTKDMVVVRRTHGRDRIEFPMGHAVYETEGYVSHPRVSPDGKRVAFLDHPLYGDNRGFVAVVDGTKQARRLTHEYQGLEGLSWSPNGTEIWFSGTESGTHFRIEAVAPSGQRAAGAGRLIYDSPGWVQILDVRKTGEALVAGSTFSGTIQGRARRDPFERDLAWGGVPLARVLSADGQLLAGAILDTGTVDYDAYVRSIDGATPIPMGHGSPQDISPDNKWLLTITPSQPPKLLLVPIGPGDSSPVVLPGLPIAARFIPPDGAHLFVACSREEGKQEWLRVRLADGRHETIARPPGVEVAFDSGARAEISPDGRELAYAPPGAPVLAIPLMGGGTSRTLIELRTGESFINWAEGNGVFVAQWQGHHARVFRVAVATGHREFVHEISVADPAGQLYRPIILISRSGGAYVYSFMRILGSLYRMDGLR